MGLPRFITFTGIDDSVDIDELDSVYCTYPVEFGILVSLSRQGRDARYPNDVARLMQGTFDKALHVCGYYSEVVDEGDVKVVQQALGPVIAGCKRVQFNGAKNVEAINKIASALDKQCIMQVDKFGNEVHPGIKQLFDTSYGTGKSPNKWPAHPKHYCGYSGGINEDNVLDILAKINAPDDMFWIDIETGVRTNDKFDVEKCLRICEKVYG